MTETLVLGASGFLGRHLLTHLAAEGQPVTATYHSSEELTMNRPNVTWRRANVLDRDVLRDLLEGHELVYHLAGVGLDAAPPATVRRINAVGTRNVVEACRETGVERLLFASTAGTRRANGPATEADRVEPVGAYQESKAQAEAAVDAAHGGPVDVVTVHPTAVLGPGDEQFTQRFLRLATSPYLLAHPPGGASFVGVEDVVSGMCAAMQRGRSGEHYLLAGENLTYAALLQRVVREIDGYPVPIELPASVIHAGGPIAEALSRIAGYHVFPFSTRMARLATQHHYYDAHKAADELGYSFGPIESPIARAWKWYKERPVSSATPRRVVRSRA